MKHILLLFILLISTTLMHSQTAKKLNGTVQSSDFVLPGIEVVNLVSKITTKTNENGGFSILAKEGESLMFISKDYEYKKINLKESDFLNTNFIIQLVEKPEELDEVVISNKIQALKIPNMKALLDTKFPDDKYSQKKNPLMNDGSIENGADFIKIARLILSAFVKKKEKIKEVPAIKFKTLVTSNLDKDFFYKTLQLKPEEVNLFIDYCDADPKSKEVLTNSNPLKIMDFLFLKNNEFNKLPKN